MHSDAEIMKIKGFAPVMKEQERYQVVASCRYVDEVCEGFPFLFTLETLNQLKVTCPTILEDSIVFFFVSENLTSLYAL